ncbi:MAG: DUF5320 domain-containing protein [Bacteroidetes bacterium]|jgi:hypothetical protein|nr:DUF5320 domain-containing protein [Bacteroidota bacterium]MBT3749006.1 DUF5320 domain-containing protein [Bacteroidota bacterium]MBT4400890.1 DUF5320 domain-containing protein [Bacteroidota bacterium]MBT4408498.1 DUF5320 domain-containing protein [Bacteroidota bacterium]MBT5425293.1 DUF5320 domain-containing protein [Bacteroidota bacterium]
MPGGNKRGPSGEGPMTGREQGYCTGNNQPGSLSNQSNFRQGSGRGSRGGFAGGSGRGQGQGFRRRSQGSGFGFRQGYQNSNFENDSYISEKTLIENEIRVLKDQLSYLEKQLSKSKDG